ncbi:MAG: hypothetical protein M3P40_01330, partial [Actinomycetota bacterium]|nr:hypothetical protein [Actinomycetota bacterium]
MAQPSVHPARSISRAAVLGLVVWRLNGHKGLVQRAAVTVRARLRLSAAGVEPAKFGVGRSHDGVMTR